MIELLLQGHVMLFVLIMFCLILSLTFHEYGHGIMAKYFGDRTAELQGRLTLNPIAHIDPMGLLMVVMIGFGFAKPVPTDPRNYRSRWGILFVAAAGPMMNLLVAFIAVNIYGLGLILKVPMFEGQAANIFFVYLANINMLLMLFNLIPIGPLDGHYILPFFLPPRMARYYQYYNDRYGHWFLLSIIGLSLLGVPIFQNIMGLSQSMLRYIILF
jgi:Zn-dependent protease